MFYRHYSLKLILKLWNVSLVVIESFNGDILVSVRRVESYLPRFSKGLHLRRCFLFKLEINVFRTLGCHFQENIYRSSWKLWVCVCFWCHSNICFGVIHSSFWCQKMSNALDSTYLIFSLQIFLWLKHDNYCHFVGLRRHHWFESVEGRSIGICSMPFLFGLETYYNFNE